MVFLVHKQFLIMAQPKRKQSKQRSRKRRGSVQFKLPHLAKDRKMALCIAHIALTQLMAHTEVVKF